MALFPIAKLKAHSLTGRITQSLLHAAFKAVRRNRGAAGIDKVSIKMFEANLADNLLALERDLKSGSFEPLPLRRHFLDKGGGKFRPLGIPAVRDRVAQEVLRRLLHPIFEPLFHQASFGFRPGRNCHQALELAIKHHEEGYRMVLDADVVGCFDNLPHSLIKEAVAAQVADGTILNLVEKFLRAGVMENGVFKPTEKVDLPDQCKVEFEPRISLPDEKAPSLDDVYAVLDARFDTGESDVAARHNEHQP